VRELEQPITTGTPASGLRHRRCRGVDVVDPWSRFAFYGRMSTEEYQDRETSSRWQRQVAEETIAGRGVIVAEYFDVCSRRLPWCERPAATALLKATADRLFDAVVVGEYERAFHPVPAQTAWCATLVTRSRGSSRTRQSGAPGFAVDAGR